MASLETQALETQALESRRTASPALFPPLPSPARQRLRVWKERCVLTSIARLRRFGPRFEQAFGILTYHRVSRWVQRDPGMLNVTPQRFRAQMEGLLRLGYEPWSLRRTLDYIRAEEPIPRDVFVVVFDDGFENVFLNAWPVLRRFKIPATIFLATRYVGARRPFPFDNWSNGELRTTPPEAWRPLSVEQCDQMLESGFIDFGSHTHTHQDFRDRAGAFREDLDRSLHFLRRQFGITEATFSFPYGFNQPALIGAARDSGVSCGLTAQCRLVRRESDRYGWGRFGAVQFDTPISLAAKLDGWYDLTRA